MKSFNQFILEDGMGAGAISVPGPTNVTGVKTSTDPISATAVSPKKQKKFLMRIKRTPPKM
jgi:hypothetical protein